MQMTEEHHAFMIGSFYQALVESLGQAGEEIFAKASKVYAKERGHRMALRAKKHGFDLDYSAYFSHSEWAPTKAAKKPAQLVEAENGDFITLVYECLWLETFRKMGAEDCAKVYCPLIDAHLVKGFNPALDFETTTFLHADDHCTFQWRKANFTQEDLAAIQAAKETFAKENIMPFVYHTGHVWKTFKAVIAEEFPEDEAGIRHLVQAAFEKTYGIEAFKQIQAYEAVDFRALP
jgi:hypothetical protein